MHADATALPFGDATFDAVVGVFVSTDVADWPRVVSEAARVLRAGGRLVHVDAHPCFVGHFAERAEALRIIHPGYREGGWHREGPGIGPGIRSRVGEHHVTLAQLVQAVLDAGLVVEQVEEPGEDDFPALLALAATR